VLSIQEVQRAVQASGFQLEQQAFYEACKAYDIEKRGQFDLLEYIGMQVFLHNSKKVFAAFDAQRTGVISLDFNKFVCTYIPCRAFLKLSSPPSLTLTPPPPTHTRD
jgi:hypothetical protein